jgi:hypothetical protein
MNDQVLDFETAVFDKEYITVADRREAIVRGGRHLFDRLPRAFEGVEQIGVIGLGPQGSAQAQNLRDSLNGAVRVTVGLRSGSGSVEQARGAGFREEDGTLGEMFEVIASSDMVLLLISDAAQTELYEKIFAALRPGTTVGFSHGFLMGFLTDQGKSFPSDVDVVAVCPKGMGASARISRRHSSWPSATATHPGRCGLYAPKLPVSPRLTMIAYVLISTPARSQPACRWPTRCRSGGPYSAFPRSSRYPVSLGS